MIVNAGLDKFLDWGSISETLTATVTDLTGTVDTVLWSQVSGPSLVNIASPTQLTTVISELVNGGVYVFKVVVTDSNQQEVEDTVQVELSNNIPDFTEETFTTDWNSSVIVQPDLLNGESKIRLKSSSLSSEDLGAIEPVIGNTELFYTFFPNLKISTSYTFTIEILDQNDLVLRELDQVVIVTPPIVNQDTVPVITGTPYSFNSNLLSSTVSTSFQGCQIRFFFNGLNIGFCEVDQNGLGELSLQQPLGEVGELTSILISGPYSSSFSAPVVVTGTVSDLEVSDVLVSCLIGEGEGLTSTYTIKNLGPDTIPSLTEIELVFQGNPELVTYSSTKSQIEEVSSKIILTLNQDLEVGDSLDISVFTDEYDCSQPISCLTLEAKLPKTFNDSCLNNKSRCKSYSPQKSEPPTINTINSGDRTITGFSCSGGLIKNLYISWGTESAIQLENLDIVVSNTNAFSINLPLDVELEPGDSVQVTVKCEGKSISDKSNPVIVGSPASLTSKCLSGIKVRGVEGQTYELQIYNFNKQKVLGRGTFSGPQFGISLPFNEPNLRDSDLEEGDCIGIKVVNSCCAPIISNKLIYSPIKNLQLNYLCSGGISSVQPSWISGSYPITMVIKNLDSGDILYSKNIKNSGQSTLLSGIPNGNLRLEVGDCGGCTEYIDFPSDCVVYSATKTVTREGTFFRQNCGSGCTPRAYVFKSTKISTKTSTESQEIADQLALDDATTTATNEVNSLGQSQANIFGFCDNCESPPPPPSGCSLPSSITISGNTNPSASSTQNYSASISGGSGYTLEWTVYGQNNMSGQGTSNITVVWGENSGTVTLRATCNGQTIDSNFLNVNIGGSTPVGSSCSLPSSITISGDTNPTENSTKTYNASINGGSGYTLEWIVYGQNNMSGQGTSNATVVWGTNNGSIFLRATCNGQTVNSNTLTIAVGSTPVGSPPVGSPPVGETCVEPTSIDITGNQTPAINSTENYGLSINGGSGTLSYVWTVQGGTINSGQGTPSVNVTWGSNTSELSSINCGVGCTGGSNPAQDYNFFTLTGGSPPVGSPPVGSPPPSGTQYYELSGCLSSDYAWTTINPTGGTGQRYVLPSQTPVFYTYTGNTQTLTTPPSSLNGSIQLVSGETSCP